MIESIIERLRERLTWRNLLIFFGALIVLVISVQWLRGEQIVIGENRWQPDALLSALSAIGLIVLGFLSLLIKRLDQPIFRKESERPIPEKIQVENRAKLLEFVEEIWITGFLDKTLNQMESLNLDLQFAEPEKVLQRDGMQDYTLPDNHAIYSAFNDLKRRLVILGEPGAGKTILLLQLAKELIAEAKAAPTKPIPIVLALSSWAVEPVLPFEQWLRQEIRNKYGVPQKVVDDMVAREQFIYLLDGLDEVAEKYRNDCLQAIKIFFEQERKKVNYVLCCRGIEWQALKRRLEMLGEVIIQALTDEQITRYLASDDFAGLLVIKENNTIIQEFSHIPFMLNTMAVVTRGKTERDIRLDIVKQNTPETLRDYFLENYVELRLKSKLHPDYTDLRQTRTRLKWLAAQLVNHAQTDFYIENLQPDWLASNAKITRYRRMYGFLDGFVFGLASGGLIGGLVVGLGVGLVGGLGIGLVTGLAGSLISWGETPKIDMGDQLTWSMNLTVLTIGLAAGLVGWLVGGLASGLVVGLGVGFWTGFTTKATMTLRRNPNEGVISTISNFGNTWVIGAISVWLLGGLAVALALGLDNWLASIYIELRSGLRYGWLLSGILSGPILGLVGSVFYGGGDAVIRHMVLRGFLARDGYIPYWRYDKFLDYCAELVILRKVGGGYRFVHDYLRQYLAGDKFVPDAVHTPPPTD
jgi:hypothetical protein